MDENERKLVVQIIGQLLIADGALTDVERTHLDAIMDTLGMPPEERKIAMKGISMDSPIEERVRALSPTVRTQLVVEAERAAHADGEPTRSEQEMLQTIRDAAG